jgi:hypothetical protein
MSLISVSYRDEAGFMILDRRETGRCGQVNEVDKLQVDFVLIRSTDSQIDGCMAIDCCFHHTKAHFHSSGISMIDF